jgi:membrane-associated HD superfamily phosphohydrolase
MEIYNDWLVSKMTHAELNQLSDEERKERKKLQRINRQKKYYKKNTEKITDRLKKYYKKNTEKIIDRNKKYQQTPNGKKVHTLANWKKNGLHEPQENLDRIYELYLNQELCNACDCVLTRNGDRCSTDVTMDHDHDTNKFRHIICRACNCNDNWKKYFC